MSLDLLKNIPQDYQLSTVAVGAIAVGMEDIRQSLDLILRTVKGSDPTRLDFGSDVFKYVDSPISTAIPNIKKAIFDGISQFEPRVRIKKITHEVLVSQNVYNITYNIVDDDILDSISWSTGGVISGDGALGNGVVITADIPLKLSNGVYQILFSLDSVTAFPTPPVSGFLSATELYQWVNTNWATYGKWHLTANQLICYLNRSVTKASLNIAQYIALTKKVAVYSLPIGEFYDIDLTLNGLQALPLFPTDINNIEALLNWLRNNYGTYGDWFLENNGATVGEGDFGDDFNSDFATGGITQNINLVFQTEKYTTATLTLS